jgi:hypothetical protein
MTGRLPGDIVLLLFTVSQRSRLTRQGTDTDDDTALRGWTLEKDSDGRLYASKTNSGV